MNKIHPGLCNVLLIGTLLAPLTCEARVGGTGQPPPCVVYTQSHYNKVTRYSDNVEVIVHREYGEL